MPTADLSRMVLKSIFKKEALQDVQFMISARKMDLRLSLDEGTLYVEITGKVAEGQTYPRAAVTHESQSTGGEWLGSAPKRH